MEHLTTIKLDIEYDDALFNITMDDESVMTLTKNTATRIFEGSIIYKPFRYSYLSNIKPTQVSSYDIIIGLNDELKIAYIVKVTGYKRLYTFSKKSNIYINDTIKVSSSDIVDKLNKCKTILCIENI